MIYSTSSPLYARFVHQLVRAPPLYPQFNIDGDNKLRPDVHGFTSADALSWAASLAKDHGTSSIILQHNCAGLKINDTWTIYWLPLYSGITLCALIHPPSSHTLGCYNNMPKKTVVCRDVEVQVNHNYMPHPLDIDKGFPSFPCNNCGFPVPSQYRMRCGGCRIACYCNSQCQLIDWPVHTRHCVCKKSFSL